MMDWFEAKCFLRNFHYYLLFWCVRHFPLSFCLFVYHHEWLGIGKLAELRGIRYYLMWKYIQRNHGIYLKD